MPGWQLTTSTMDPANRQQAWRHAMQRLCLPVGPLPAGEDFEGRICCAISPMGMEFARVTASALEIAGSFPDQQAALWLGAQLAGTAMVEAEGRSLALTPDMILYGPTGVALSMRQITKFDVLFVKVPRVALNARLPVPVGLRLGCITSDDGAARVFMGLLRATAEVLPDLSPVTLRPVELAVTEFLITCLSPSSSASMAPGGFERPLRNQTSFLQLICQTIERRLPDPDLGLRLVAEEHGISSRQLQQMFATIDDSFNGYVRQRRLERARGDLGNPLYDQLSISEICYRWGFSSTPYFSRSFRKHYGLSPREYRVEATARQ